MKPHLANSPFYHFKIIITIWFFFVLKIACENLWLLKLKVFKNAAANTWKILDQILFFSSNDNKNTQSHTHTQTSLYAYPTHIHNKISQFHPVHGNNADSFYHDKNSAVIVVHKVCVCVRLFAFFLFSPPVSWVNFEIEYVEKRSRIRIVYKIEMFLCVCCCCCWVLPLAARI